jgi:hypothetical protein
MVSRNGNARGGKQFSRGALYHMLSNPIYLGEIRHKHECHPGQHEAIVTRELWERVQQRLRDRGMRNGEGRKTEAPSSPLAGKLFDESSELFMRKAPPKASAVTAIMFREHW